MRKRFLSILLCLCMMLGLLPATALATDYPDGWPDDPSVLVADTDIVTIDNIDYTYKGEADTSGIQMYNGDEMSYDALTEAYCWKAGSGYVLYNPMVESGKTTSAEVTLHNATISTESATALDLPITGNMYDGAFPVPVTVYVEDENSLATSDATKYALYNGGGNNTRITGGGALSLTNSASSGFYSSFSGTVVTIDSGTQVTVNGGSENAIGDITVTGSDSKLTIVSGTVLKVTTTCTVADGAKLENNGTLKMMYKTTDEPGITGEISGSGGIVFPSVSNTVYCLVDDKFIPYGGDISESGLNISGKNTATGNNDDAYKAPTEMTRYKAGDGYALFTPQGGGAKAKLELHGAIINTTDATALNLPTAEPVDITVTGDNSLTAGGSGNVINTNGQVMSVTGSGNLTLAGPYYGINGNGGGAVSISINGDLTFDTAFQPISTGGDVTVSAKSITSKSGYYFNSGNGTVSLTATDGDIVIDDTGREFKQEKIKGTNGITLNAPNGKIDITQGGSCDALNSSSGTITMTALDDVIINASSGGAIYSGKIDTSDVVSVNSTNGSIQMNCGDYYECVQASGGVALTAAKDITLNGTETDSVAIQASSQDVSLTAGGKLSSTTAYGFQVGTLTIKADEVSIAGTQQDGIQANSVSITNTDGTNNCKSVSITATSDSDSRAAVNSSNVTIKADDVLICGNNKAKAIMAQNSAGTVTIGDAGMIIGAISISGTREINPNILMIESTGAEASSGLDLSNPPAAITYYKAGDGYALFAPANGETKATLTLHNASITSGSVTPLELGAETVIKLEGANSLTNSNTDSDVGIRAISSTTGECQPVTIQGDSGASLTVSAWQCSNMGALTIDGCSVTMNGECYGILAEGNMVLKNAAKVSASGGDDGDAVRLEDLSETEQYSLTVNSGSTLTVNESDAYITGDFTIGGSGSKVTINSGVTASVVGAVNVENSGMLENNGILEMKLGTMTDEIKALKLTGSGLVRVRTNEDGPPIWATYTNEGVKVKEISGSLDLSVGDHSSATVTKDGYAWNDSNNTLTLGDVIITGGLTLPDNTIINTASGSTISGSIGGAGGSHTHITFRGTAPLEINGGISLGTNGDSVTVEGGANVTVSGSLSLGVYDGTLNVTGSGTTMSISSQYGYGVLCGEVNVENGATLTTKAAGSNSTGLKVEKINGASGNVKVTGGSTLTTGCDYGVYIIDGTLTVDSSSKLITNGTVAPFCVVDKSSSKVQGDAVNIPNAMLPKGTEISSVQGSTAFSGKKYTYWSLIQDEVLGVKDETADGWATLTGAAKGTLTFKQEEVVKKHSSDSSSGVGLTPTLTFKTNGGSDISSISKTSGTAIDLKGYKPTRDGYVFAGWYSDEGLTKKVTKVTLTANTTVYAKWTETPGEVTKTNELQNPFTDVANSDYYYDAVQWAVEKEITSGTSDNSFSPSRICTRGQMVAFLWRAMGSPEPAATNSPFVDVSQGAYYYKAVLWAVENKITAGTTATTFAPTATVTRGQTVTFLWRAAGKPAATMANPYTDISKGVYNYDAVLWAAEKGITQGTTSTTFSPNTPCTRAQIVTFLHRYMM